VIAHATNANTYHPWGTYIRAREEARRRGDRRCGTEHLLVALLGDPEIEEMAGVTVARARGSLDSLDRTALEAIGFDASVDAPPLPTLDPLTPAAKAALRDASRPIRRGRNTTPQQVLACLVRLEHPDPVATLLDAMGVDRAALQRRLSGSSPTEA
jgi:ATP-dependent Clp protease ATP-binding subunit ClpA